MPRTMRISDWRKPASAADAKIGKIIQGGGALIALSAKWSRANPSPNSLAVSGAALREDALRRFSLLQHHVHDGPSLSRRVCSHDATATGESIPIPERASVASALTPAARTLRRPQSGPGAGRHGGRVLPFIQDEYLAKGINKSIKGYVLDGHVSIFGQSRAKGARSVFGGRYV